jgi:hypothetical protein
LDLDQNAVVIDQADVVIISLSSCFAVARNGYQSLIFATRTLQKPFRYLNLMSTYEALTSDPQYRGSSTCLIVGAAVVYSSWRALLEGWAFLFKTNDISTQHSDSHMLPPIDGWRYLSVFAEASRSAVVEITNMLPAYRFFELTETLTARDCESPQCCLVFVTYALATNLHHRQIIDSIISNGVPMVVVAINDSGNWLKSGLGILLANELWVDFRRRAFYTPGEHVPSTAARVHELSVRLRNACSKVSSHNLSQVIPMKKLKVFQCHSWSNSDHATMGLSWPITSDDEILFLKDHDTIRYALALQKDPQIRLGKLICYSLK